MKTRRPITSIAGDSARETNAEQWEFNLPFLQSATYTAAAERPGFKKTLRDARFLLGGLRGDSAQFVAHPYSSYRCFAPYVQ